MTVRIIDAWNGWYHLNGNTYGTCIRGDERGWRARHHREHVEGDYKNPPDPSHHVAERTYSSAHTDTPIRLSPEARAVACNELVASLIYQRIEIIACAVDDHHFHILAQFVLPEKPTGSNPWASVVPTPRLRPPSPFEISNLKFLISNSPPTPPSRAHTTTKSSHPRKLPPVHDLSVRGEPMPATTNDAILTTWFEEQGNLQAVIDKHQLTAAHIHGRSAPSKSLQATLKPPTLSRIQIKAASALEPTNVDRFLEHPFTPDNVKDIPAGALVNFAVV